MLKGGGGGTNLWSIQCRGGTELLMASRYWNQDSLMQLWATGRIIFTF